MAGNGSRHASWLAGLLVFPLAALAQGQGTAARQSGTVTAVEGTKLSLTTSARAQVSVNVAADATVLRLPPCGTSLKEATPSTFASIASGDRVITGKAGDADSASRVILMKASDIAACRTQQQADWQKNGSSGLVKSVDGMTLTVASGPRTLKVNTVGTTVFRRYADDSVSFEDARPGTLAQIQPGDQISVRGTRSQDGTIAAQEVVTGTFQNLSGALSAVDPAAGTITLKDLLTKKTVTVKVTANSDLRKLPAQAATIFARRASGEAGSASGAGSAAPAPAAPAPGAPGPGAAAQGAGSGEGAGRSRGAGFDLSRAMARFPTETVADLHSGDAVLLVASSSQGSGSGAGSGSGLTAITLLSGVEPLLSARPAGAQPITLSPWNIGGAPDAGGAGGPQ